MSGSKFGGRVQGGWVRGDTSCAMDFAIELSRSWGMRASLRVEDIRANLPPMWDKRIHEDGPTWEILPLPTTNPPSADVRAENTPATTDPRVRDERKSA